MGFAMIKEWRHRTRTAGRIAPLRVIRRNLMVLAVIAIVPSMLNSI
jgi:hypothetical protein